MKRSPAEALEAMIDAGQATHAEAMIREALRSEPNDPGLLLTLGRCLIQLDRSDEAIRVVCSVLQDQPENTYALRLLAVATYTNEPVIERELFETLTSHRRRHVKRSLDIAKRAVAIAPTNADVLALTARLSIDAGQNEAAAQFARRALACNPHDPIARESLTLAYQRRGRIEKAIAENHQALRNTPDGDDAHATRGWLLLDQKQYDAAAEAFRSALRINPEEFNHLVGLKESRWRKFFIYRTSVRIQAILEKFGADYDRNFRWAICFWVLGGIVLVPLNYLLLIDSPTIMAPAWGVFVMSVLLAGLLALIVLLPFIALCWFVPGLYWVGHTILRMVLWRLCREGSS